MQTSRSAPTRERCGFSASIEISTPSPATMSLAASGLASCTGHWRGLTCRHRSNTTPIGSTPATCSRSIRGFSPGPASSTRRAEKNFRHLLGFGTRPLGPRPHGAPRSGCRHSRGSRLPDAARDRLSPGIAPLIVHVGESVAKDRLRRLELAQRMPAGSQRRARERRQLRCGDKRDCQRSQTS
jgi:hypothetical protein